MDHRLDRNHISRTSEAHRRENGAILAYQDRIVVKRASTTFTSITPRRGGGIRGSIVSCTKQSRMNFHFKANQIVGLDYLVTLTYPPTAIPKCHKEARNHWDRLRRWLNKFLGGITMWEFQENGAVHLHLLVTKEVDEEELKARWYKIVGSNDPNHREHGARVEPVRNIHKTISYLAKIDQKMVPEEYVGMGRFWATFGKIEAIPPKEYLPTEAGYQTKVRAVRKLKQASCRKRGVRCSKDRGRVGFKYLTPHVKSITSKLDRMDE